MPPSRTEVRNNAEEHAQLQLARSEREVPGRKRSIPDMGWNHPPATRQRLECRAPSRSTFQDIGNGLAKPTKGAVIDLDEDKGTDELPHWAQFAPGRTPPSATVQARKTRRTPVFEPAANLHGFGDEASVHTVGRSPPVADVGPGRNAARHHSQRTKQESKVREVNARTDARGGPRQDSGSRRRDIQILDDDDTEVNPNHLLPMTCGGSACRAQAAPYMQRGDLRNLRLQLSHAKRPLWTCPDGRIIFEACHPQGIEVADFLIAIAEPVSRPEIVHEYQITLLSLHAAVSTGIPVEQIITVLDKLSKNDLDEDFLRFIRETGRSIGKLKMVLRNNHHFLESSDRALLYRLCSDPDIADSLIHYNGEAEDGDQAASAAPIEVNSLRVESVKAAAHRLNLPLLQEYDYQHDFTGKNPELQAFLKPSVNLRPYQQQAISHMFSVDGVAKSGMVVLPCGAGKTLVGITACCRIRRRALVLTTTSVAVDQWRRQFQQYTTISPEDVYVLTAESKRPIQDAERRACIVISTYSMMGYAGRRSGESEAILHQVQQLEWGLLVVDEVQVMPARTFRTVATTVKAHCSLGLTATLVREDNLIYDLHWLIGPKLYEVSWQQLQEDGYISRVRCVEMWCEMSKAFFEEYLRAMDNKDEAMRRALWTCNPNKLKVCEYLIRFHEHRGDKTIVFSDNIFILEEFAKHLGRYYICGKVDMRERMQILSAFQDSTSCNTIFLSKVGDNAIDIPNASVIIQISAHYGSRRQEAQRLGRILRPKPRPFNAETKYNAFFYSIVSRDTQEMYYANRRQQFLVEQGYNYHVLRDHSVDRMNDQNLVYASEEAQLTLLKQVLESVKRGDGLEAEGEDVALRETGATTTVRDVGTMRADGQGEVNGQTSRGQEDEKVSLAGLSGGLDGMYSVTAVPPRRAKPPD